MSLGRMFIKAKIEEKKGLYVSTITYSFYGFYHYNEITVSNTVEEAERLLLKERCSGKIAYELEKK